MKLFIINLSFSKHYKYLKRKKQETRKMNNNPLETLCLHTNEQQKVFNANLEAQLGYDNLGQAQWSPSLLSLLSFQAAKNINLWN